MKKILLCFMVVTAMALLYSCQQSNGGKCHIVGTVHGEAYEGKRIFLVPLNGPATAETVVLDYHYRAGLQQLIVVSEPGTIQVTIDSISHATGTPQNDSLEQWKIQTEIHNRQLGMMRKNIVSLNKQGDSLQAKYIQQRADSFHLVYKNYTRQLAKNMEGSVLGDFLMSLYPLTYKRQLPDGRIVTMNADTNEEIPE